MNYGFRVLLSGLAGIALSSLWLWMGYRFNQVDFVDPLQTALRKYAILAIAGFYLYHGFYGLIKTYLHKALSYGVFAFAGAYIFFIARELANDFFLNEHLLEMYSWNLSAPQQTWEPLRLFFIPVLLGLGPVLYNHYRAKILGNPTIRRLFIWEKGGSASFAGPEVFSRRKMKFKGLYSPDISQKGILTDHIFAGRTLFDDNFKHQLVGFKDDAHFLTIGTPGSGKTTAVLRHCLATYIGSIFILDIKGEHAETTFAHRSSKDWLNRHNIPGTAEKNLPHGQCYALDPFGILRTKGIPSFCYNPLSEINIHDPNIRAYVGAIADACVLKESSHENGAHFTEWSKLLIEAVIVYVLSECPKADHNLPYVADLIDGVDRSALGQANPQLFQDLIINMTGVTAAGGIARTAAMKLKTMGERERGAVLSTVARSLKWITDPAMRQHLSRSDFLLKDLGSKATNQWNGFSKEIPETIYIVIPPGQLSQQNRWMRLMSSLIVQYMTKSNAKRNTPSLIILDEFARLGGNIQAIEDGMNTLRWKSVKIWPVIQELSQLKQDYPKIWSSFIGPANVQVLGVGMGDLETAEWISKALGQKRVQRTNGREGLWKLYRKKVVHETVREIMTPTEVMEMLTKTSSMQLILPNNSRPMRLERVTFKSLRIEGSRYRTFHGGALKGHFEDW